MNEEMVGWADSLGRLYGGTHYYGKYLLIEAQYYEDMTARNLWL